MPHTDRFLRRALASLCALAFVLSAGSLAHAELRARVQGYADWAAALAALQNDRSAQHSVLDVSVEDTATRQTVACEEYALQLDAAGAQAFAVEPCAPATRITRLRLRNRSALFEHGDLVPRPRPMELTVVQTRSARAQGTGQLPAGSDVDCSVAVRPFLRNLETGTQLYLQPGRFVLRSLATQVQAFVQGHGWRLLAPASVGASLRVAYEIVDSRNGEVVLREEATLTCAHQDNSVVADPVAPTEPPPSLVLAGAGVTQGNTTGQPNYFHGSCGGADSPEQGYALEVHEPTLMVAEASGDFAPILYLREGPATGFEMACSASSQSGSHASLTQTLAPGVYHLFVDGAHGSGAFSLLLHLTSLAGVPGGNPQLSSGGPQLTLGVPVTGSTALGANNLRGTCGGGSAPEQVYRLEITREGTYSATVRASYDSVLYLRRANGNEVGCNDDTETVTHSRVTAYLTPGWYEVVVDGFGSHEGNYTVAVVAGPTEAAFAIGTTSVVSPAGPAASGAQPLFDWRRPVFDLTATVSMYASGTRLGLLRGPTLGVQMDVPVTPRTRLFFGPQFTALFGSCTGSLGPLGSVCDTGTVSQGHVDVTEWLLYVPLGIQGNLMDGWLRPFFTVGPALSWVSAVAPYGGSVGSTLTMQPGMQIQGGLEIALARVLRLYGSLDGHLFRVESPFGTLVQPSIGGQLGLRFAL